MLSRVFVHFENGLPASRNLYDCWHGFRLRGHRVEAFDDATLATVPFTRDDIVTGGISIMRRAFERLGVAMPAPLDYPATLRALLARRIESTTLGAIRTGEPYPLFIKPHEGKRFTGLLVRSRLDLLRVAHLDDDVAVWASEPRTFVSEWRVYVLRGEVLGIGHYTGDPLRFPARERVRELLDAYTDAPVAFALDVGITDDGRSDLVEVNDAYALGNYGIPSALYVQMLEARWGEIVAG